MNSKSLIIIEEPSQIDALISLAKAGREENAEPVLVALNSSVKGELGKRGLSFKTYEDYGFLEESTEYVDIDGKGFDWLRSTVDIKIDRNKNLKEALTYDGASIWWLVEEQIYSSRFAFHSLGEIIKRVFLLDCIIKTEAPSTVCYADNGTSASIVTEFICKKRNIATATICRSSAIRRYLSHQLKAFLFIYGQWLRILARKKYWALLGKSAISRNLPIKRKILIFSGPSWITEYSLLTRKLRKSDVFFGSTIDLFKNDSEIAFVDIPIGNWGLTTLKEKNQQRDIIRRPFEYYLNMKIVLKALKESKKLHRDYRLLSRSAGFRDSLNYNGLPLQELIGRNLSLFFSRPYLVIIISFIEMANRMLATENPDIVLLGGESYTEGRALINRAKLRDIPTLLLQHGLYYRYVMYYNHIDGDIGPNKEATAPYCPIPDKFAMQDKYTKDIMVRYGKISAEDVIITGVPRYDIFTRANEILNREEIFRKLQLDPDKKLVTWMTQPSATDERNISAVYNAMKSLKDAQLVVKLHPSQEVKGSVYLKDRSYIPLVISGEGAITLELLYASDIIIAWQSTVAIEALILDKPLIVINFIGKPVPPQYVDTGAAVYIDKEDKLKPAIESILYDREAQQRLSAARHRFLSDNGYRLDGQASKRVADLVVSMIEESKNKKAAVNNGG
jgi:hypothetical protein